MRRRAVFTLALTTLAAICAGCVRAPGPADTNLLVITVDTLRADRLGSYGYGSIETPGIDRLAAEGVRFARVVTPSPTTLPAHSSLFTGATPPRHGVRDNAGGRLRQSVVTLAERFREAGFATAAFVAAFVLDPRSGISQGFGTFTAPGVAPGNAPTGLSQAERRGDAVMEDALPWIRDQGSGRWFAWIHLFDPHAPYTPPEPWASRYAGQPYDGEVAYTDSLVDNLRTALEESGQWDNTTVVFTSDHGEALGQHGEPAHGFFLYDTTLKVPLILRPADSLEDRLARGAVVDTQVGLIDVFPTIVELWDLEPGEQVEGRSLVAALRGEPVTPLALYSETILPQLYFGWSDLRAITDDGEKYIEAPRPELYDLAADPDEEHNLLRERSERAAELKQQLDEWISRAESLAPDQDTTDPDTLARLRSLGYLAVGGGSTGAGAGDLPDPKDKIETYQNLMLALGAWRQGAVDDAVTLIDEEIEREPGFAGAWHYRGLVLSGNRDEAAAEAFARALELDPDHTIAARELARTHRRLGRLEDAADVLEALIVDTPLDIELRFELAGVYLEGMELSNAERTLQEGLELRPDATRLMLGMGLLELRRARPAAALEHLDRAAELAPQLGDVQYQRGVALQQLDRNREALDAYAAELNQRPLHFGASFGRAVLLAQEGRNADAIDALRVAVRVRPSAPEPRLLLAQALVDTGDTQVLGEARRLAEGAVGAVQNPQLRSMGHATLAQIYQALGRHEEARAQQDAAERITRGSGHPAGEDRR